MRSYSKYILEKLTGKSSLQDISIEELQQLADRFPYFGATQFFLAKKLYKENNNGFESAAQKAALHFDSSLLLNVELEAEEDVAVTIHENDFEIDEYKDVNESIHATIDQNLFPVKDKLEEDEFENDYDEEAETEPEQTTQTEEVINERLSNLLKGQAAEFEKPVEADEKLPEENVPFHRIDYFESQGIKLDAEKETDDKLGKRLRRFTDWLKDMKSINPNLTNIAPDAVGEIQAQNMAARSNEPKEIVTEAMAEVLVKQGKPEQAIQVYQKLSFSNPSKSAYFAAKILELKGK